jgi:antirestriction protein ArdC
MHWSGHPSRLARDLSGRFGDDAYAAEELVAELGAAIACTHLGVTPTPRADHAAYLAGWLAVLKAGPTALFTVAAKAQAAVDHLEGYQTAATR